MEDDAIDLSGDGGVLKNIVRRAKPDAISPSESLPLVDGAFYHYQFPARLFTLTAWKIGSLCVQAISWALEDLIVHFPILESLNL